jgi:hypothetical protein
MYVVTMEAVRTSETSVHFNETTRRYIPEGCHLHASRREDLKSHVYTKFCEHEVDLAVT